MLLLIQFSPILVHGSSEADYECKEALNEDKSVKSANAKLIKGCVLNDFGIYFFLGAMYEAANLKSPKPSGVVISISEAEFINYDINLINPGGIPSDINAQVPLLFTMRNSKMSGTSKLEFGNIGEIFKLPPKSVIRIIDSQLTISSTGTNVDFITLHSLQLVTESSIEITRNVITVECKGCEYMSVFYIPSSTDMEISGKSSFTLHDNQITMTGLNQLSLDKDLYQSVLYGSNGTFTISGNSNFTWHPIIIKMVGHIVARNMYQRVWYVNIGLTISQASTYTWVSNTISMVGYDLKGILHQYIWNNGNNAPLTISETSIYKWASNDISMTVHDVAKDVHQTVWLTHVSVTITSSQFLFERNTILMLAKDYVSIDSYVLRLQGSTGGAISKGSSMIWRNNCLGMVHKDTDKRHVFAGKWSITGTGSELLLDGNYITTTDKYGASDRLTQLVLGATGDTDITISNTGTLTIGNTNVYSNSAADGATTSMLWKSSMFTSKDSVMNPVMDWVSSAAMDSGGSPIPTLTEANLRQYMCVGLPNITPKATVTPTLIVPSPPGPIPPNPGGKPVPPKPVPKPDKAGSNATKLPKGNQLLLYHPLIPAVLITSVVLLYLV